MVGFESNLAGGAETGQLGAERALCLARLVAPGGAEGGEQPSRDVVHQLTDFMAQGYKVPGGAVFKASPEEDVLQVVILGFCL